MRIMIVIGIALAAGAAAALFTGCDGTPPDVAARKAAIQTDTHHGTPTDTQASDVDVAPSAAHVRLELVGGTATSEPAGFVVLPWVESGGAWLPLEPARRFVPGAPVELDVPSSVGLYFQVLALVSEGELEIAVSP